MASGWTLRKNWRNKDKIFPINRKKAGGLAWQGFWLSLFSREGICLLSCGGKTVPLVQFCQRKPPEEKMGRCFLWFLGQKSGCALWFFSFFAKKPLRIFGKGIQWDKRGIFDFPDRGLRYGTIFYYKRRYCESQNGCHCQCGEYIPSGRRRRGRRHSSGSRQRAAGRMRNPWRLQNR